MKFSKEPFFLHSSTIISAGAELPRAAVALHRDNGPQAHQDGQTDEIGNRFRKALKANDKNGNRIMQMEHKNTAFRTELENFANGKTTND